MIKRLGPGVRRTRNGSDETSGSVYRTVRDGAGSRAGRTRPRYRDLSVLKLVLPFAAAWIAACDNPQRPIVCGAIPRQSVFTGESITVKACFEDPNGDVLVYAATTSDPGVATAVTVGNAVTVEALAPGTVFVTVTAADAGGLAAEQRFQVLVPNRAPVAAGTIPPLELAVDDSTAMDVSGYFNDPEGQELSYTAAVTDTGVARVSEVGSVLTVSARRKGVASVTVTATDPGGLSAVQSFAVTVPNRAPEPVGSIPEGTVDAGNTVTHVLARYFRDPDGDALVYAAITADPAVAGVSVSGGTLSVAGLAKGTATVTVTATDTEGLTAVQAFAVTVPNRAPVAVGAVPADTLTVGTTGTYEASPYFSDPDGDLLVYAAASSDPAVAGVTASAGAIAVTALARGEATVTITATDTEGLSAPQMFTVTVPNRAPVAVGEVPADTVAVGNTATLDPSAHFSDPDGDPLSYAATTVDTTVIGVAIADGAVAISALAKGEGTVTVTATDTEGLTATRSFVVTVPNRAPNTVGSVPEGTVEVGETITRGLASYFHDPDGDALLYSATAVDPTVAGVSVSGGTLSVAALAKGATTVTVTATDTEGLTATQWFTVAVPNRAPVAVAMVSADTLSVGEFATLDPSPYFSDPDADALVYEASSSDPAVARASASAGTISVTAIAKGEATVSITATDTEGLSATQMFTVTVPNRAPFAVGVAPSHTVAVGNTQPLDPSAHFSDPDGDTLAYTATTADTTVIGIAASGGAVAITAIAKGEGTVTVTASDMEGLTATQSFSVTVPNRPPSTRDPIQPRTLEVGDSVTLDLAAHFSDPDGDPLSFSAAASDAMVAGVAVSDDLLTVAARAKGTTTVTVTASDGDAASVAQTFTVSVGNRSPVAVDTLGAWALTNGDSATLELSPYFSDPDGDPLTFAVGVTDTAVVEVSVSGATLTMVTASAGVATVTVTATDDEGLAATHEFSVTVSMRNRAPVAVGVLPELRVSEKGVARVRPSTVFDDPDGDTLVFEAESSDSKVAKAWVSLGTVLVRGVSEGISTVTITARDPAGLSAAQEFAVRVRQARDPNPNRAPVAVGTIPDLSLEEGDLFTLNVTSRFSDPDEDELTFAAAGSDSTVVALGVSGSAVKLEALAEGAAEITVTASDPKRLTATHAFSVTVSEATGINRPPTVIGVLDEQILAEGHTMSLDASSYFSDPDNDELSFTASSSNVTAVTTVLSGTRVEIEAVSPGLATVRVGASDPDGLTASLDFDVFVGDSTLGTAQCRNGFAGEFPCRGIDLLSRLTREQMGVSFQYDAIVNDVWGWTDPVTGTEWALVGHDTGVSFISLRNPLRPVYAGILPLTPGSSWSDWRDIKVYGNYAFVVADWSDNGMQVFDLTQLRNVSAPPETFSATTTYTRILSAHNIVINKATGFAYSVGGSGGDDTCGGGLHMIDIRTPTSPRFVGCFADTSTGQLGTGYTHDAMCVTYRGPDTEHQGKEVCFSASETRLGIADVTDKDNPVALSSASYPSVGYAHQGWLDDQHEYFYMNDELDEYNGGGNTRTLVWDVKDLDDPVIARQFSHATGVIDHNLYVVGDRMYQSNYLAGLRVLNIANRENPVEIAYFDVEPGSDAAEFAGSWSNYPFFASGVIPVTSISGGVFFVRLSN